MTDRNLQPDEDEVEIERLAIDLPDGEDPDLGAEIAHHVVRRLNELLEGI